MKNPLDLKLILTATAILEALYAIAGVMPPRLVFPMTGWVLNADGHWITKLLAMALATQAMTAWAMRHQPHLGVAKALVFYQFASATVDWTMWIRERSRVLEPAGTCRRARRDPEPLRARRLAAARYSAGVPSGEAAMTAMKWVVRFCALYNAGAIVMFLVPGMLGLVGVREPYSPFWRWLPATMAMFPTIVLWISAQELTPYATFPFYNGLIRMTFAVAAIVLDFGATAGAVSARPVCSVPLQRKQCCMSEAPSRKESTIELPAYTRLAALYCELAERHGIAREKLLANSGLHAAQLAQPEHAIRFETLKRIARSALAELRRPSLGIEHGLLLSIRSFGFLGYAALSSSTLGAALDLLLGYYRPYAVVDVSVRVEGGGVIVQFDEREPWDELLPLAMDSTIVNFHKTLRELAGDVSPVEIRLAYAEQGHHRVLRQMVRGTVHFQCGSNQYCFSAATLSRPICSADPTLLKLAVAQCEREMQRVSDESSILSRVRNRVVARLGRGAPLERVARDLHITSRTLRRRLESSGCTYHEVVEEVRRTLAIDQLVSSRRTVEQIV